MWASPCAWRITKTLPGLPALVMIASRRRSGTSSRKNPSRLPTVSVDWSDRPVMLPPGRAEDDRDSRRRLLYRGDYAPRCDNDIDLQRDELGRDLGEALATPFRPANLDLDVSAFCPTEFL